MLREKAIRKMFITTLTAFILLVIYLIPTTVEKEEVLKTNLEIEYITGIGTNSIYLLNDNGYLVKSRILLDTNDRCEQVKILLTNLIDKENAKFPNRLKATIPSNTKILDISYQENVVTINFSSEFLEVSQEVEKPMIESIVFSIMELESVDGVIIQVEGERLEEYPNSKDVLPPLLTKSIGINKKYDLSGRNNINRVVIYYLENIDDNIYYVPVTKYLNDDRDKIKIIIDELATNYIYETNLMSFLNSNLKLLDYEEKENIMFLNFNEFLFDKDDKILEEVIYSICYSTFDNYDVTNVFLQVNGKTVEEVSIDDLL